MKILADESVDAPVVKALRQAGHYVEFVLEISPGIPDTDVLQLAIQKKMFLITSDKDFGELTVKSKKQHRGVLLYRLSGLSNERKSELIVDVIKEREPELIENFSVISVNQLRIRKIKS